MILTMNHSSNTHLYEIAILADSLLNNFITFVISEGCRLQSSDLIFELWIFNFKVFLIANIYLHDSTAAYIL